MHRTSSWPARAFAPVLITSLAFAACGDDDDEQPFPTETGTTSATATTATQTASPSTATGTATTPSATATTATATASGTPAGADTNAKSTQPDSTAARPHPQLTDVRSAEHDESGGFDRIVFEWTGGLPGAEVSYVANANQCGSGAAVDLEGDAILMVRFPDAAAHTEQGQATFGRQEIDGPGDMIEEAVQVCDFEGVVAWAVGVDERAPFSLSTLGSPSRVVIDVLHDD